MPSLPTNAAEEWRTWFETTFQEHRPLLLHIVLRSGFTEKDAEDLVQDQFVKLLEKAPVRPLNPRAFLSTCVRRATIDLVRKRAGGLGRNTSPFDGGDELVDETQPSPLENVRRHEQAARRRLLVCDLFASYVEHVEQGERWEQREVMERSLRGQQPKMIAAEMNILPAEVYSYRFSETQWLADQVAERDGTGSVLMSAFTTPPPTVELAPAPLPSPQAALAPPQRPQVPTDAPLPTSMAAIVAWAINEAGALCPSDKRLSVAHTKGFADWPGDLRYHIVQSGCTLCAERLASGAF